MQNVVSILRVSTKKQLREGDGIENQRRGNNEYIRRKPTEKKYKTFVTTWPPARGAVRVVVVSEPSGWVAFFCTDPAATVADVLEAVASWFSLEVTFRDVKDVVGAGQQRVRRARARVGAFHVRPWTFTLTEAWTWGGTRTGWSGAEASPRGTTGRGAESRRQAAGVAAGIAGR